MASESLRLIKSFARNFQRTCKSKLKPLEVNHLYQFCRYRFDPENHLLESEGSAISLTPKAFEILLVLVQNGTRLTTKEELMRKVWPDSFVEEANLTVNISALRRHLGETPSGRQYIETVPRKGYRFAVPVSQLLVADHLAGPPLVPQATPPPQVASVPREDFWMGTCRYQAPTTGAGLAQLSWHSA